MLVLFETAAGFAVFKLLSEKKLKRSENLYLDFENPESAEKVVKFKRFQQFKDMTEALSSATATIEGKMSKPLKKLMKKLVSSDAQEELAVADAKLGNIIKEKFDIQCVSNNHIQELMRCISSQRDSLLSGIGEKELASMSLGLAHSLSRYKLKFTPDKVDTMIIQAISLLDDLDKELNNYVMRAREWYGWHFPELSKIVTDNMAFARTVLKLRERTNAHECDLSDILPEEVEAEVKEAAEISMGTEISTDDITHIGFLCEQVIDISEFRTNLYEYVKNRMFAVTPNFSTLVGELVGARLISHAGSVMNLAKHPSSTVQILGAEKALFRALKAKHDTPKYGLLYHAALVGQTTPKNKGKLSRMLAAKASLAIRVDALGDDTNAELGLEHRAKLEKRARELDNKGFQRLSGTGKKAAKWDKYENKSEVRPYYTAADSTLPSVPKKRIVEVEEDGPKPAKKIKTEPDADGDTSVEDHESEKKQKKKKKRKSEDGLDTSQVSSGLDVSTDRESEKKKKKKKRKSEDGLDTSQVSSGLDVSTDGSGEKKKKKKKKSKVQEDD